MEHVCHPRRHYPACPSIQSQHHQPAILERQPGALELGCTMKERAPTCSPSAALTWTVPLQDRPGRDEQRWQPAPPEKIPSPSTWNGRGTPVFLAPPTWPGAATMLSCNVGGMLLPMPKNSLFLPRFSEFSFFLKKKKILFTYF